jgi:MGT family glycosyltransferase
MPVMSRMVGSGHAVRIMAGPGVRPSRIPISSDLLRRIATSGAALVPFCEPTVHPFDGTAPPKGLFGTWVPPGFKTIAFEAQFEAQTGAWAPAWATNVAEELRNQATDLVVADFVLTGALAAAEAAGLPSVVLAHNVVLGPVPGVPPKGPGWLPARGPFGRARAALGRTIITNLYRHISLPPLNEARARLGLAKLRSPFEQYERAARVLLLASAAWDYPALQLPDNFRYVGTPIDDVESGPWVSPWPLTDTRPLLLVSLSTLNQGQAPLMQRILSAVAALQELRVLVTSGPSLNPADFKTAPNVRAERFIPHSAVLPHIAAMVTQCGLGTIGKALACGVPLLCIPLHADQPDNAARIVARGVGIRVRSDASSEEIGSAIQRLIAEPRFRRAASALSATLMQEGDAAQRAVDEIEAIGYTRSPMRA